MLYCLSFHSLSFCEAEQLILGVTPLYYKCNQKSCKGQAHTTEGKQMFPKYIKICKGNNFA